MLGEVYKENFRKYLDLDKMARISSMVDTRLPVFFAFIENNNGSVIEFL